jgi:hypothetical protein
MRGKENLKKWIWCGLILLLTTCTAAADKIIYVDDDAAGANDGSSWVNAYNYLQDALAVASQGDEIRVAQGIYQPDLGGGNTPGDRRATFQLINGVNIKGGYAGVGEADPNAVNVNLYKSFLSGDLNCDDVGRGLPERISHIPLKRDNSCHIVTGSGVDETAILNGFTIIGGYCTSDDCNDTPRGGAAIRTESGCPKILNCFITFNDSFGGGVVLNNDSNTTFVGCIFSKNDSLTMENIASSPEITNCTFESNDVGMKNGNGSSPVLTNCIFRDNSSGMENYTGSKPILTNCIFERNRYGFMNGSDVVLIDCTFRNNEWYGLESWGNLIISKCTFENNGWGGIQTMGSNLTLSDCLFSGNSGFNGGAGIHSLNSDLILYNCKFVGNQTHVGGGGIYHSGGGGNIKLYNCIFSSNSGFFGGAIESHGFGGSLLTLHNCIISDNSADAEGGGIFALSSKVMLYNCTVSGNYAERYGGGIYNFGIGSALTMTNCIVWGNTPDQIDGEAIVSYSNVQGGFSGEGNINVDPLFADPENVDYHLKSQAGRWDPNNGRWTMDDVTSPCIDAGDPHSAWTAWNIEPQPNGGRINMGAYGGTPEASLSLAAN